MQLLLPSHINQLRANDAAQKAANGEKMDTKPVVKLFNPCGAATWLISEMQDDGDTLFGLCDLGFGCAELGYVSLSELTGVRLPGGLGIERDIHFKAKKSLVEYADEAYALGHIAA